MQYRLGNMLTNLQLPSPCGGIMHTVLRDMGDELKPIFQKRPSLKGKVVEFLEKWIRVCLELVCVSNRWYCRSYR